MNFKIYCDVDNIFECQRTKICKYIIQLNQKLDYILWNYWEGNVIRINKIIHICTYIIYMSTRSRMQFWDLKCGIYPYENMNKIYMYVRLSESCQKKFV